MNAISRHLRFNLLIPVLILYIGSVAAVIIWSYAYHTDLLQQSVSTLAATGNSDLPEVSLVRHLLAGLFLILLSAPVMLITRKAIRMSTGEAERLAEQLKQDVQHQQKREDELKDAIKDLERFNSVAAGRESRILELKAEINALLEEMNREKRYNIDRTD